MIPMSDTCHSSDITTEIYKLFKSEETGMFYWTLYSKKFSVDHSCKDTINNYYSQSFESEEVAIEARKNNILRLNLK